MAPGIGQAQVYALTRINCFNLRNHLYYRYPHFTDEETSAQRRKLTRGGSHSSRVAEPRVKPRRWGSRVCTEDRRVAVFLFSKYLTSLSFFFFN